MRACGNFAFGDVAAMVVLVLLGLQQLGLASFSVIGSIRVISSAVRGSLFGCLAVLALCAIG